ncbi:MAG: MTH1187 family thiamine-binding protein [Candidatus Methanosuratus sp.]|nr:MTH1187 family thiamine-binding protein [Candidatus Methanosuratincola sp.]
MGKKVVVEFSIVPVGTRGTSLSVYVAKACEAVERAGAKYQLTPMGTVFEADSLDQAFDVIRAAHEAVLGSGTKRVLTSIRIDDRRDKERTMEDKVRVVEDRLSKQCPH